MHSQKAAASTTSERSGSDGGRREGDAVNNPGMPAAAGNGYRGDWKRNTAVSWSKAKRKENQGRPGHITQSLDGFARWGQGDM